MIRGVAVGACVAATAVATAASADGVRSFDLIRAEHVANKVVRLERHNKFGMRGRIGGPFKVARATCDRGVRPDRADCEYIATGVNADANGMRMRCSVKVYEWLRSGNRIGWKRHVSACARQSWGAP